MTAAALPLEDGVLAALEAEFDEKTLLTGERIPERNLKDWSGLGPQMPLALLRPASTEAVSRAMSILSAYSVPVVPQGGMTGLCGGARPVDNGVALSLERMNRIEELDPSSATMTVQAGTVLETMQEAAAARGLYLPLDLGARGSCTIGGNIATNAGGNRVIRYGMTRDMVLGLETVLADGTVLHGLNKMIKNNAGFNLRQVFIGSEGTMGVITRAVLKLSTLPAFSTGAVCSFASYQDVVAFLAAARQHLGPLLSAFEVMWPDYWQQIAKTPGLRMPLAQGHAFYVLIEAQGSNGRLDSRKFDDFLESQAETGLFTDAVIAQSSSDLNDFWLVRDAVSEFGQTFGSHASFDIGLPVAEMDRFISATREALSASFPQAHALFYGHVGDGNLHIVARDEASAVQPKGAISEIVYKIVGEFGGTISAEHGIGLTKKPYLRVSRTPEEIETMRRLKLALDPRNILNPGKVF